jgi:aspartate aminotransferase
VARQADRIITMRTQLKGYLEEYGSTLNWDHVVNQIGMFCYTGLTPAQVDTMVSDQQHNTLLPDARWGLDDSCYAAV